MKGKRWILGLYVALMVAGLAAVGLLTAAHYAQEDQLFFENRMMATRPEVTGESLASGGFFSDLERFFCDRAAGRNTLLKLKTKAELEVLHRPVVNGIVVTDGETLLAYEEYEAVDRETMAAQAEEMARRLETLQNRVESCGGTFLYVAVPSHYAYCADKYPPWLNDRADYTQTELELFSAALEERGVNWLDMGKVWEEEGHPEEYMSSVDHHYTWAGAWSTYRAMMARLNEDQEEPLRVLNEEDVEVRELPNPFLGSWSRKLCGQWKGNEPFRYAVLREELPVTRYDWGNDTPSLAGWITRPESDWENVFYGYMCGDIGETVLQTGRPELPDALIFGDSFTNPLETIWYTSFDETRSLDLRYYDAMSLTEYVETYRPQVVICVRDYEQLLNLFGNGNIQ